MAWLQKDNSFTNTKLGGELQFHNFPQIYIHDYFRECTEAPHITSNSPISKTWHGTHAAVKPSKTMRRVRLTWLCNLDRVLIVKNSKTMNVLQSGIKGGWNPRV